ncbi:MAG: aminoacyl-tRNA hydrolase [Nitrospirae bacterium]|nr:aminoacyl-tRNA hydrolase [Nitrospirota bacterium]
MWLIIGLGNPGMSYSKARHNLGFMVLDAISFRFSIPIDKKAKNYIYGKGSIEGKDVILAKPITFMNRSGLAVKDAIRKYSDIDNVMVIHDDLDLDIGVLRIKKGGSSGGHKGVDSVIEIIGSGDFIRLKLGIGRSKSLPAEEYVLKNFSKAEEPLIKNCIENAGDAVAVIIDKGTPYAQNKFHRKL